MKEIEILELHVTNSCNLACESCSHFSNDHHRGILSLEEANEWIKQWNQRIKPRVFCLLGGEPTLNPRLAEMIVLAGTCWQQSRIWLTTNGFLLHKHPRLAAALQKVGGLMMISIHDNSPEYLRRISGSIRLLHDWRTQYKFGVSHIDSYRYWTRRYHGNGAAVTPYSDNDPRSSWENCGAKLCRQLFRGKIWKCSTIAYLQLQKETYPALSSSWDRYLAYKPLEPTCTNEELDQFFAREEEDICNMCPARPELFKKPSPLRDAAAVRTVEAQVGVSSCAGDHGGGKQRSQSAHGSPVKN